MGNDDCLLASANLAPHGMDPILPQYDNLPTRRWLEQFLIEHEITDGSLQIDIRRQNNLEWFQADYVFEADTSTSIGGRHIEFKSGDALQLFVSHRYTPESAYAIFTEHGLILSTPSYPKTGRKASFFAALNKPEASPAPPELWALHASGKRCLTQSCQHGKERLRRSNLLAKIFKRMGQGSQTGQPNCRNRNVFKKTFI